MRMARTGQDYRSNKLALRSAGDYGDKPVTSALTEFIQSWEFYDFQPEPHTPCVIN